MKVLLVLKTLEKSISIMHVDLVSFNLNKIILALFFFKLKSFSKKAYDNCYNEEKEKRCGERGTCVNEIEKNDFKCRCRMFFTGKYCEECK